MGLTTDQCCCGCSIRTGTYIILFINLFIAIEGTIMIATKGDNVMQIYWGVSLIVAALAVIALFAIIPELMVPWLLVALLQLVVTTLIAVVILVLIFASPKESQNAYRTFIDKVQKTTAGFIGEKTIPNITSATTLQIIVSCIFAILINCVLFHFWKVVYTYYLVMKDEY